MLALAHRRERVELTAGREAASQAGCCRGRTARAAMREHRSRDRGSGAGRAGRPASTWGHGARESSSSRRAGRVLRRTGPRTRRRSPGAIESPAAARWPPQRSSSSEHAPEPAVQVEARDRAAGALPVPVTCRRSATTGPVELLDEPGGDDADHAPRAQSSPATTYAAPLAGAPRATTRPGRSPRARCGPRLPAAPCFSSSSEFGEPACVVGIVCEEELGAAGPSGGRDAPPR